MMLILGATSVWWTLAIRLIAVIMHGILYARDWVVSVISVVCVCQAGLNAGMRNLGDERRLGLVRALVSAAKAIVRRNTGNPRQIHSQHRVFALKYLEAVSASKMVG